MNKLAILISLFCLSLSSSPVGAQLFDCIDFSDQQPGSQYQNLPEGTIIAQYPGIADVSYEAFRSRNGEFSFGGVSVDSSSFHPQLTSPRLFLGRAAVGFDFWGPASQVCFATNLDGGEVVLGINGTVEAFQSWDDPAITRSFADFDFSFDPIAERLTTICVGGLLEELVVGGEEIVLDDVCVDYTNNCVTEDLFWQANCLNQDTVSLSLDFDPADQVNNDFFDLYLDEEFYGFYRFDALPIQVPIYWSQQDDEELYVRICENDNPDCCYRERIDLVPCVEEGCVGFELVQDRFLDAFGAADPLGMTYYVEQGVSFTVAEAYRNGSVLGDRSLTRFFVTPGNPTFPAGRAIVAGHQNINSFVDLTGFSGRVTEVQIDFALLGNRDALINYTANDQDVVEIRLPTNSTVLETTLRDGTEINILLDRERPTTGTITFIGSDLRNLTFGGEELLMDNFCLGQHACNTRLVNLGQHACAANSDTATIYFDLRNYPNQNGRFEVRADGQGLGVFSYSDLPITRLPIPADPGDTVILSIVDLAFGESCTLEEALYVRACSETCIDFRADFLGVECEWADFPTLILGLSSPPAGQEVIVSIPGTTESFLTNYGNSGLVIDDPVYVFAELIEIFDALSGCTARFRPSQYVDPDYCINCEISELTTRVLSCTDEVYELQLNFAFYSPNTEAASFLVTIDGAQYGVYDLADFPLSLEGIPYDPNQAAQEVIVEEVTYGGCAADARFEISCQDACAEFGADITQVECEANEGFVVTMIVWGVEPGTEVLIEDFFGNYETEARLNDNNVARFFWPGELGAGALRVTSRSNNCVQEFDYSFARFCEDCELEAVNIDLTPCQSGRFSVGIQLLGGSPNQTYTIIVNNEVYIRDAVAGVGYFYGPPNGLTAEDLPLTIVVEGNSTSSNCRWEETISDSPCESDCEDVARDLATACNDGVAILEFLATNPNPVNPGRFSVSVLGEVYTFEYGAEAYRLELPDNPTARYEIVFRDLENGCEQPVVIDNPCFCFIEFEGVRTTDCATDGSYYIELALVTGASWNTAEFILEAGPYRQEVPVGTFSTRLGPFFEPVVEIVVFERSREECVAQFRIESDCESTECEIVELRAEATACENGQYFIEGSFGARNTDGPFFALVEGDDQIVPVSAGQPFRLGPFVVTDFPRALLTVTAGNFICSAETIVVPDCESDGECNFSDLIVEPYACDEGQFLADITFRNPNGGDAGFYVFANGSIYGPFAYNASFVTIGPLNGTRTTHNIMVLDIDDPSCFANYTLEYSCNDDCRISQVLTRAGCDGEVFYVELDVEGRNLGETFTVVGNGQNYGVFSYDELPLNLGPFDNQAGTVLEFGVIDLQSPSCTNFTEVIAPNCRPCSIRDLTYEVDCNSGSYELSIDFIAENPRSDSWLLEIDGEVYERFSYANLPVFLRFDRIIETIRVRDAEAEDCASEPLAIEIPCCDLREYEGQVRISECQADGTYYLVVSEVSGFNLSDSVAITYVPAGSSIVETIITSYASLPLEIGPLSTPSQTTYSVAISDLERDCGLSYQVVAERCDNNACIEFEGFDGIFGTNLGNEDGEILYRENGVRLSFEEPGGECSCNLFGIPANSVPDLTFGAGQAVFTQGSGFGLHFEDAEVPFNTVNMDFYYPGGSLTMRVNGAEAVTVEFAQELPAEIAAGVSLRVTMDDQDDRLGLFTFSGEIVSIEISTTLIAGFDNVCMSQDDNVWPGDGNYNGIADHFDLLNMGIAFGNTGPARTNASSEWSSFIAANWRSSFADGLNYKHADANGDGVVDDADREVLVANYGQVHGTVTEVEALPYTDTDPPIFVDMDEGREHRPGGQFEIPVVAGSAESEMRDVYGLAFTVQLDPSLIDLETVEIVYPVSWFGDPAVNTMTIHRLYPDGRLEVALSRIDGNNVSGHGVIVYVRGLIDDIAGLTGHTAVYPDQVVAQDNSGIQLPLRPQGSTLTVTSTEDGVFDSDLLKESFTVFPNPTQAQVFFRNALGLPVDHLALYAVDGRQVLSQKKPGNQLDLRGLPAGIYLLKVRVQGQLITTRIVKTEP